MEQRFKSDFAGMARIKKDLEEMLRATMEERCQLLKKRPSLVEFQKEIDDYLGKAGGADNRMAVLGFMMEARFEKLRQIVSNLDARPVKGTLIKQTAPEPGGADASGVAPLYQSIMKV